MSHFLARCRACGREEPWRAGHLMCECGQPMEMHQGVLPQERWPRWAKMVARLWRRPEDAGVGDSFKHLADNVGATAAMKLLEKAGLPAAGCGCGNRQARWNRLYPY